MKKDYTTPEVVELGNLADLTKAWWDPSPKPGGPDAKKPNDLFGPLIGPS